MQIQAKTFLIVVFSLLGILPVIYVGVIWYAMNLQHYVGSSRVAFKQFLLENTKHLEGRIIIESGSNSDHSIDSLAIEKAFGKTTINIAEAASIPLDLKLHRLRPHLKRGDIVLLPLEYPYYDHVPITEGFYDVIYNAPALGYFTSMPPQQAIQLILRMPIKHLSSIRRIFSQIFRGRQVKINDFIHQFNQGLRGDYIQRNPPVNLPGITCLSMVFRGLSSITVSKSFTKELELLKRIEQESGAKFFFTFPFVAGEECYEGELHPLVSRLENEIRETLSASNLPLIGTKENALLSSQYFYDTHYHATLKGRAIRTQKLIEAIHTSPYHDFFQSQNPQQNFKIDFDTPLTPLQFNQIHLLSKNQNIALGKGWRSRESHGVWSEGDESNLIFRINKDHLGKEFFIELDSRLLGDSADLTKAFVNGNYLGEFHMNGKTILPLKNEILEGDTIELVLKNTNVQSPRELGLGNDDGKIKLYLKSITIKDK